MKILYVVTEDWYFVSHRLDLAIAAREAGFTPVVATRSGAECPRIVAAGIRHIPFELARASGNPIAEIASLIRLYRREKPDLIHHVALKPVVYGSLAARFVKNMKIVNAVAGLGWLFASSSLKAKLMRPLAKGAIGMLLRTPRTLTIVQNPDDEALLREIGVKASSLRLIRGAGVDIEVFSPRPEAEGPIRIVLASRMLRDKGVYEFVEAARQLSKLTTPTGQSVKFTLVGPVDAGNPAAIPERQLIEWVHDGVVEWWGARKDMPSVFHQAHIVCLPSYREGLPKVLIEAAACGRPIVSTDAPGCREVVRHMENGLLVPIRDASALADAISQLVRDETLRAEMGRKGRDLAISEFSNQRIVAETIGVYRELTTQRPNHA